MSDLVRSYGSRTEFLADPDLPEHVKANAEEIGGNLMSDNVIKATRDKSADNKLDLLAAVLGQRPALIKGRVRFTLQ